MMRPHILTTAALLGLTLSSPAALAETAAERAARCAGQAWIVGRAVDLRVQGTEESRAASSIGASDSGLDPKYAPGVTVLVGWVYSLPKDQLTAEAATAFEAQCLAYTP